MVDTGGTSSCFEGNGKTLNKNDYTNWTAEKTFQQLKFLLVYPLDHNLCPILILKIDKIRLKHNGDVVLEILLICLFILFNKFNELNVV